MIKKVDHNPIPLFTMPITLKDGVEIKEFDSKIKDYSHVIIIEGRHYHINSSTYTLIETIKQSNSIEGIVNKYHERGDISIDESDVIIGINELFAKRGIVQTIKAVNYKRETKYLYFKIPIFPEKVLLPITNILKILFSPQLLNLTFPILIVINISIIIENSITHSFVILGSVPYSAFILMLFSGISLLFHEFGHVSACRYFGAKHGEIGGGIYIRFPVLYSNLTDAWRLTNKQRAIVDIAGVYFQLIFNVVLYVLYLLTEEKAFLITIQFVCIGLIMTLNPFFRFDGYWIASDLSGIPNLRKRSVEYFEYFSKRYIFQKRETQRPSNLNIEKKQLHLLILYSFISNTFFLCFIIFSCFYFNTIISIYKKELFFIYDQSTLLNNYKFSFVILYKIFTRIFIITMFTFFFYRMAKVAVTILKKIYELVCVRKRNEATHD